MVQYHRRTSPGNQIWQFADKWCLVLTLLNPIWLREGSSILKFLSEWRWKRTSFTPKNIYWQRIGPGWGRNQNIKYWRAINAGLQRQMEWSGRDPHDSSAGLLPNRDWWWSEALTYHPLVISQVHWLRILNPGATSGSPIKMFAILSTLVWYAATTTQV